MSFVQAHPTGKALTSFEAQRRVNEVGPMDRGRGGGRKGEAQYRRAASRRSSLPADGSADRSWLNPVGFSSGLICLVCLLVGVLSDLTLSVELVVDLLSVGSFFRFDRFSWFSVGV